MAAGLVFRELQGAHLDWHVGWQSEWLSEWELPAAVAVAADVVIAASALPESILYLMLAVAAQESEEMLRAALVRLQLEG